MSNEFAIYAKKNCIDLLNALCTFKSIFVNNLILAILRMFLIIRQTKDILESSILGAPLRGFKGHFSKPLPWNYMAFFHLFYHHHRLQIASS